MRMGHVLPTWKVEHGLHGKACEHGNASSLPLSRGDICAVRPAKQIRPWPLCSVLHCTQTGLAPSLSLSPLSPLCPLCIPSRRVILLLLLLYRYCSVLRTVSSLAFRTKHRLLLPTSTTSNSNVVPTQPFSCCRNPASGDGRISWV